MAQDELEDPHEPLLAKSILQKERDYKINDVPNVLIYNLPLLDGPILCVSVFIAVFQLAV